MNLLKSKETDAGGKVPANPLMRLRLIFGIGLFMAMAGHAQMYLEWDAGDQATGYDVFQHVGTNWVLIGQTNATKFPITNQYVAYAIRSTTEGTNKSGVTVVPGQPRSGKVITNILQSANSPTGPWINETTFVWRATSDSPEFSRFFRSWLSVSGQ